MVTKILTNHVLPNANNAIEAMRELGYDSVQLSVDIDRREKADEKKLGFKELPPITAATTPERIAKLPAEIDRRIQAAANYDPTLILMADQQHAMDCEYQAIQQAYPSKYRQYLSGPLLSIEHNVPEVAWAAKIVTANSGAASLAAASALSNRSKKVAR